MLSRIDCSLLGSLFTPTLKFVVELDGFERIFTPKNVVKHSDYKYIKITVGQVSAIFSSDEPISKSAF